MPRRKNPKRPVCQKCKGRRTRQGGCWQSGCYNSHYCCTCSRCFTPKSAGGDKEGDPVYNFRYVPGRYVRGKFKAWRS